MKVIIAGGGTGGHLFPGIALAEEFLKRDGSSEVLFIGTDRGIEKRILPETGYPLAALDIEGLKGKSPGKVLAALLKIPRGILRSVEIIRNFQPDLVIGVGGYASGPAVLAARMMGLPTAIAEQNALPGWTNRILGRFADRVFLAYAETGRWFSKGKCIVTGNPIRAAFLEGKDEGTRREGEPFTILVFGGSQGARAVNEAMIEALVFLKDVKDGLRIIHQTGPDHIDRVRRAYAAHEMDAEVSPFIMDMARAYQNADLLICRAGATSIAEITASGKTAILIPFPYAVGDHQRLNAEVLAKAGAAVMIAEKDLSGPGLAEAIKRFHRNPGLIREMAEKSAALGHPRAAAEIVDACLRFVPAAK
ncbi:MAG: undecaprenyldiphospho-muramoylpentapeptide beta-N-acetylglucosaminyltransferase [Deltaproteobacteria bacterium]|nr:undecaprenyldiphospho-muramoylpentapeptide beta-N-acetylglucosaminyltransferase [Deltaproteobacteria bacterium]